MANYISVEVITRTDDLGQNLPYQIVWSDRKKYTIKRIIHVCQPEDMMIRYTILIANKQRQLFFNGKDWKLCVI